MKIEDEFFPVIAGELGTSKETAQHYQKKLKDFQPQIKVTYTAVFVSLEARESTEEAPVLFIPLNNPFLSSLIR